MGLPTEITLESLQRYWEEEWQSKADTRSEDWPLVKSPVPMLSWLVFYLLFVIVGPRIMKNFKPFELRGFMAIYNLSMVVWSAYMMTEFYLSTSYLDNRFCTAVDFSDSPQATRVASVVWVTLISKAVEFTDTYIFILRKKASQVTFLHVYHHAVVLVVAYMAVKWYPGGISWFWPCINSFIHFLMYSYYFVSAMGPQYQKYLWWKKYLTLMQIIQFVMGIGVILYSFAFKCDHDPEWLIIMGSYLFSLLILFTLFYLGKYKTPTSGKQSSKKE